MIIGNLFVSQHESNDLSLIVKVKLNYLVYWQLNKPTKVSNNRLYNLLNKIIKFKQGDCPRST